MITAEPICSTPARLSVVVPIYNVDIYLQQCLDSLSAQTLHAIEFILVDDGSTDASCAIARTHAQADPRFRLVHQAHRGPGAARNTGLRHLSAATAYVAFVDSDDTVPADAFESLVNSLDATESDFATGVKLRLWRERTFTDRGEWKFRSGTMVGTDMHNVPELMHDASVLGKVYRKDFFTHAGNTFPEGQMCEDLAIALRLCCRARRVDVIAKTVYHWRLRDRGELSITQAAMLPQWLVDHVQAVESARSWLAAWDDPSANATLENLDRHLLSVRIPSLFMWLVLGGREYRAAYRTHAGRLLDSLPVKARSEQGIILRMSYTLADRISRVGGRNQGAFRLHRRAAMAFNWFELVAARCRSRPRA